METTDTTAGVTPADPRWQELVQAVIAADAIRNWLIGDAALEIAPMGDDGVNTGALEHLRAFADEVGIQFGSVRVYRDVAHAWPPPTRVGASSWSVHRELIAHPGLIEAGMTVAQAKAAVDQVKSDKLAALIPCADGCDYPDDSEVCGVCGVEFNEPDWAIDPDKLETAPEVKVPAADKPVPADPAVSVLELHHHVEAEVKAIKAMNLSGVDVGGQATIRTYVESMGELLQHILDALEPVSV